MTTVRISDDALAVACGAEQVAAAFEKAGCKVERVSSWGMHWLEPLVEIDGLGWGPVKTGDVEDILSRQPELGSASVPPPSDTVRAEEWTLNQVQGDGIADAHERGS